MGLLRPDAVAGKLLHQQLLHKGELFLHQRAHLHVHVPDVLRDDAEKDHLGGLVQHLRLAQHIEKLYLVGRGGRRELRLDLREGEAVDGARLVIRLENIDDDEMLGAAEAAEELIGHHSPLNKLNRLGKAPAILDPADEVDTESLVLHQDVAKA